MKFSVFSIEGRGVPDEGLGVVVDGPALLNLVSGAGFEVYVVGLRV